MPFGLANAPALFQALANDVSQDYLNQCVFVNIDYTLIFSRSLEEHQRHVRQVMHRLWENQLCIKAEMFTFHASSVPFLGYIVDRGQLRPDPEKVRNMVEWPTPTSRKELQPFLGFWETVVLRFSPYLSPPLPSPLFCLRRQLQPCNL